MYRASGAPPWVSAAARTDVGACRVHNEDAFLISDLTRELSHGPDAARIKCDAPHALAFGVYDGCGGRSSGETASRLAALVIHVWLSRPAPTTAPELERRLVDVVRAAGHAVFEDARQNPDRRGNGTTATVAALCDDRLLVAQVGDSRGYLLRGGRLALITRDQTLVEALVEAGQLSPEEAATFEHASVMLQALGTNDRVQVGLTAVALCRGDTLLLCTDGLWREVGDAAIAAALRAQGDPDAAGAALIDAASRAGGHDNATVVVATFAGDDFPPPPLDGRVDVAELARMRLDPDTGDPPEAPP